MDVKLKIEYLPIGELTPYERNAKQHPQEQIEQIKRSIADNGMCDPIGVWGEKNTVVEGHGRLIACKELGMDTVPVIRLDHLTDEQRREYTLIHNQTTMNSGWDFDIVGAELAELPEFDSEFYGFELPNDDEPQDIIEDEEPEEVETRCKPGDIWKLGNHRLICGDSTDVTVIDRLMDGVKADMVFTDPPYNIGYQGVSDKRTVKNDKMDDESFVEFLKSSLMNCETMYVCCSWQYAHLFRRAIEENGNKIKAMIVWDKVNPAQHLDKYFKQHEIIWYCGKFGGEKTLRGDIWQVKRQVNTVHPTMKPIELIAMALQDNPDKKIVYDGFGGSGSTLIACEQLNRKRYMCELDPHYCDVILQRWENFTGKTAVLANE